MNYPITILLPVLSSHTFNNNFTRLISYRTYYARFPIEMIPFSARTSVIVTVI